MCDILESIVAEKIIIDHLLSNNVLSESQFGFLPGRSTCTQLLAVVVVVVVVIQFLSGVVPLTEMAGFTPFLLQLLTLRPSTCLVSGHPPSNQSSLTPLPLASSRSSSVVLAFSCHFE